MSEVVQIISVVLGTFATIVAGVLTYRLGVEKNKNDAHRLAIDDLTTRTAAAEAEQAKQRTEAEERVKQRATERDQDRQDRESALEQVRRDREQDQKLVIFQRETINNIYSDIKELRLDNTELHKQVIFLTKTNDLIQRDFNISEEDRKAKTLDLQAAQQDLLRVSTALGEANHTVAALKREMEVQQESHERELKHINTVSGLQKDELQRQIDEMRTEHHRQLTQLQISEGPRNLEVTHLRYTLREAHRRLSPVQIEELTTTLLDRGLSYDGLLFPKPDPLLMLTGQNNPEDPTPDVDPMTGLVKKTA